MPVRTLAGMRRRRAWAALVVAAAVAAVADQATKAVVRAMLELGELRDVAGPFVLHHVRNSGILGGHLQGSAVPIGLATTVALAALVVYLARRARPSALEMAAGGLVLGGGIGNLVDRLRLGYVTDFLDRGSGGAFNVADVSIMAGLVAFGLATLLRRSRPIPERASE
jgi:signal peptidase II